MCVDGSERLIDLDKITVPTLVICGDKDPYLDYGLVNSSPEHLPEGSRLEIIKGESHVVYIEKPCYHLFQDKLIDFLRQ
ncbi:MAG: alpha/beta hydrolase [Lachnospiraceae bacterium]|nr:alpha/beta hydrolase [Lachnospiraceae bacterium]